MGDLIDAAVDRKLLSKGSAGIITRELDLHEITHSEARKRLREEAMQNYAKKRRVRELCSLASDAFVENPLADIDTRHQREVTDMATQLVPLGIVTSHERNYAVQQGIDARSWVSPESVRAAGGGYKR